MICIPVKREREKEKQSNVMKTYGVYPIVVSVLCNKLVEVYLNK